MSFLTPLFLLLGLLAIPIIVMYMLRLRRRDVVVSSTLLWQKLLRDREANAPWQKLRRNLLLILQLLILAALAIALARPFIPIPSVVTGNVVVLLDGSASMQATDVSPDRFEAARTRVNTLIGELAAGDQMTLILVREQPIVLASATGDRPALRQALAGAGPSSGGANWAAAVALAGGAAQGFRDARIVVVSDGGLPEELPPMPAEVVYLPIGESGENLALTALATRPTPAGPQLFANVSNYGAAARTTLLSISLDGGLFDSRRIEVPAGGNTPVSWALPEGVTVIEAHLSDQSDDFLPLDDRAWAVHEGGVANRTLLVTPGNLFLEQMFRVLPGVELVMAGPEDDLAAQGVDEFDLVILDSVAVPEPVPAADLLIINPQATDSNGESEPLLQVTGIMTRPVVTRLVEEPLLQFVDWSGVSIREAKQVEAAGARPIVSAEEGPLLLIGQRGGYRHAILTFDLHDSDLPLQVAFPILMANLTSWLNPGRAFDAPTGLQPGEPIAITPGASTTAVRITRPDGIGWTAEVDDGGEIFFTDTDSLGLYQVSLQDSGGIRSAGSFAVNLFAAGESMIAPVETIRLGQGAIGGEDAEAVGQREFWPWLLLLALAILMLEWWVYYRGATFPLISTLRRLVGRRHEI